MIKIPGNLENFINKIKEKAELTRSEVLDLMDKKKEGFRGRIDSAVAVSMVADDLKITLNGDSEPSKKTEKPKKPEVADEFEIVVHEKQEALPISVIPRYPTDDEILFVIQRHRFIKERLLDKNDTMMIQGHKFVMKSGWRKFINAFGISIEILSEKVYERGSDTVAEYRVKAITPSGQFVMGEGTKTKSEYWSDKYQNFGSYTLHNLKATARTRAINIAVSDLVGYGASNYESLPRKVINGEVNYNNNEALPEKTFEHKE